MIESKPEPVENQQEELKEEESKQQIDDIKTETEIVVEGVPVS